MESGPTLPHTSGVRHPSLAELREGTHPEASEHLKSCPQCQSVILADGVDSAPIPLDLPKGLVTENAFKWPADPIARGGMAAIYAGEDRRLGRTVILKAPREGDDLPPGMAEMFQRRVTAEARILAKLQHPAIVTIHELGKSTVGWPFCVLERVEGISLRDRLDELAEAEKTEGKPKTRERLELLSNLVSIAEALAYAHERHVVHRDCTPNNILLGKRGEATLIDWGIARDLEAPGHDSDASAINDMPPSMSGRMVTISAGTPPYLPYEQTQGRQAEPAYDVYSFGMSLYEVVAGQTPFQWQTVDDSQRGKQLMRFIEWAKSGEPAPPAMPKDRELSGIIARAIDRDSTQRFTADQLVRALKQYLTGDLVFSHRYSLTGRLSRWARRNRAVAVGLVSLIAFVIAGALVWAQYSRTARKAAEANEQAAKAEQAALTAGKAAESARADAEREGREADEAQRQATDALAVADKAQKEGKNADALRKRADDLRSAADSKRKKAEDLEKQAKTTAEDAIKRSEEANRIKEQAERERDNARLARGSAESERDNALTARSNAERERDAAVTARSNAERERDAAVNARGNAERERDSAKTAQGDAEKQRDAAKDNQVNAEKDRDAAVATRGAVEKERDDARRRITELERQLRERRNRQDPPPDPAPAPNP